MKLEPGMAYNTKRLNKVFAVLSIVFLFVVIWLILDDYIRPWKGFQVKALKIKQEVLKVAVMSSVMLICAFTILGAFVVRMS